MYTCMDIARACPSTLGAFDVRADSLVVISHAPSGQLRDDLRGLPQITETELREPLHLVGIKEAFARANALLRTFHLCERIAGAIV